MPKQGLIAHMGEIIDKRDTKKLGLKTRANQWFIDASYRNKTIKLFFVLYVLYVYRSLDTMRTDKIQYFINDIKMDLSACKRYKANKKIASD